MQSSLLSLCFVFCLVVVSVHAYGEDTTTAGVPGAIPSWQARSFATLLNLLRVDPPHFRDAYLLDYNPFMNLTLTTYAPQTALRFDNGLIQAASYHSYDIAITPNCTAGSASCNGTTSGNRSHYYYPCGSSYEATAALYLGDPRQTLAYFICQQKSGACVADAADQYRSVFLFPNYLATGIGYYENSNKTLDYYWVIDIGNIQCNPVDTPLIMGSHFYNNSQTVFAAVWSSNAAPQQAYVNIEGVEYNMQLTLGNQTHSGYTFTQPQGTACRQYFFGFMDSKGMMRRFPDTGKLITYGEGSCNSSFIAGPGFPTTTTTSSTSTTQASTNSTTGGGTSSTSGTSVTSTTTSRLTSSATTLMIDSVALLFVAFVIFI